MGYRGRSTLALEVLEVCALSLSYSLQKSKMPLQKQKKAHNLANCEPSLPLSLKTTTIVSSRKRSRLRLRQSRDSRRTPGKTRGL